MKEERILSFIRYEFAYGYGKSHSIGESPNTKSSPSLRPIIEELNYSKLHVPNCKNGT